MERLSLHIDAIGVLAGGPTTTAGLLGDSNPVGMTVQAVETHQQAALSE